MNLHLCSVEECVKIIQSEDRTVLVALEEARDAVTLFIKALVPRFQAGGRLIMIGAGTSGRLGVLDASEAPPTFMIEPGRIIGIIAGGDSALRKSSEGKEDDPQGALPDLQILKLDEKDTLLGIAAGGTTPYVLGALQYASSLPQKPLTGFLFCTHLDNPPDVNHLIKVETGPEVLTGSTRMKAGTATKMVLNTISTTLMVQTGRVYQNLMVELRATNDKLFDRAARIVSTLTGLERGAALELVRTAEGSVKAAIVMQKLGVGYGEALARLELSHGKLSVVLGEEGL